jgi:hypothetical protein
MSIRRLSAWGLPSLFLLIIGAILIAINLVDSRYGEVAFTIGLLVVGAIALFYGVSDDHQNDELRQQAAHQEKAASASDDRGTSTMPRLPSGRRVDWLSMGVVAGFVGTTILTIGIMAAYECARLLGTNSDSASVVQNWLFSLTHNPATDTARVNLPVALILHFGTGILFGILYAGWIEPRLSGSGLRRGAIFSIVPWLFSIIVFLPLMDGGFLGIGLHAGPLPVIGNLILNLAYGVSLGFFYAVEQWQTDSGKLEDAGAGRIVERSLRVSAIGVAFGMVCGGLLGQIGASTLSPGQDPLLVAVIAAIIGSFIGFMLGSYAGLTPEADRS